MRAEQQQASLSGTEMRLPMVTAGRPDHTERSGHASSSHAGWTEPQTQLFQQLVLVPHFDPLNTVDTHYMGLGGVKGIKVWYEHKLLKQLSLRFGPPSMAAGGMAGPLDMVRAACRDHRKPHLGPR